MLGAVELWMVLVALFGWLVLMGLLALALGGVGTVIQFVDNRWTDRKLRKSGMERDEDGMWHHTEDG